MEKIFIYKKVQAYRKMHSSFSILKRKVFRIRFINNFYKIGYTGKFFKQNCSQYLSHNRKGKTEFYVYYFLI